MKLGARGFVYGNPIRFDEDAWRWVYIYDLTPSDYASRPCPKCGRMPTPEGYDGCLGYISGIGGACCGHRVQEAFIVFDDESQLRGTAAEEFFAQMR